MNWYKTAQEGNLSQTIWYHGGKRDFNTPGTFLSTSIEYAKKFASQRGDKGVYEITINPETKLYPEPYWWQDYEEMKTFWSSSWAGYDAIEVIEPNGENNSIVIINPNIITNVRYIEEKEEDNNELV